MGIGVHYRIIMFNNVKEWTFSRPLYCLYSHALPKHECLHCKPTTSNFDNSDKFCIHSVDGQQHFEVAGQQKYDRAVSLILEGTSQDVMSNECKMELKSKC